jgi:lipoprotein LprG
MACLGLATVLTAGCSSNTPQADPKTLVQQTTDALRAARTVHVSVLGRDLPQTGNALLSVEGDAQKPNTFTGTVRVHAASITTDLQILSADGKLYAKLPFTTQFAALDPATYGFGNPGNLLGDTGVLSFLAQATDLQARDSQRAAGEVLDEVAAKIPGPLVAAVLTSAAPQQPFDALLGVVRGSHQLRTVTLTGPFFDAAHPTTYDIRLGPYDLPVSVPPTPGGAPSSGAPSSGAPSSGAGGAPMSPGPSPTS